MSGPVSHQASCVAIRGRAILIEGPPGSGKSSLLLALLERGAALVGDDGVELEVVAGRLKAAPHPQIAGLVEVRNLGLLRLAEPVAAPVALVVVFDPNAPRFIDASETCERHGVSLPLIRLDPASPNLALKAELALDHYGIVAS
jgi:hypothetical protein